MGSEPKVGVEPESTRANTLWAVLGKTLAPPLIIKAAISPTRADLNPYDKAVIHKQQMFGFSQGSFQGLMRTINTMPTKIVVIDNNRFIVDIDRKK